MIEINIGNEKIESTLPVELDSCGCVVVPNSESPLKAECPQSGALSNQVLHMTLENLLSPEKKSQINKDAQYYYCSDADCPVVYFSNTEVPIFEIGDLTVKVFSKDKSEEVNACYCFGWTRKRLTDQIKNEGRSTAFSEITEEVKAGRCECKIKNPKGVCCLGDIQNFLKENTDA